MFTYNLFKVSKSYTKAFNVYYLQRFTNPITGLDYHIENKIYTGLVYNNSVSGQSDSYFVFKNKYVSYIKTSDELKNFYSKNIMKGYEFEPVFPLKVEEYDIKGDMYIFRDVIGDNKREILKTYVKLRLVSASPYVLGLTTGSLFFNWLV